MEHATGGLSAGCVAAEHSLVLPMGIAEIGGFAESLENGDRAELFGILLDMADEADPVDSGSDSVTEALERRSQVESGESTMLSDDAFWEPGIVDVLVSE